MCIALQYYSGRHGGLVDSDNAKRNGGLQLGKHKSQDKVSKTLFGGFFVS